VSHELYLVARNPGETGDLFNLDWLEFVAPAEVSNLAVPTPMAAGEQATATVDLANRTAEPVRATVELDVPAGWTTEPVDATANAGETVQVRVPLTPPADGVATGPVTEVVITAHATGASGHPTAHTYLTPPVADAVFALDAGAANSPLQAGYQRLEPATGYAETTGFGWSANAALESRDRGSPEALRRDMVTSKQDATLRLRIPAGAHTVSLLRGDAQYAAQPLVVTVDGQRVVDGGVELGANRWGWDQFTVDGGTEGRTVDLTFGIDVDQYWRVNAIIVAGPVAKAAS
jgi:hypothetical protein